MNNEEIILRELAAIRKQNDSLKSKIKNIENSAAIILFLVAVTAFFFVSVLRIPIAVGFIIIFCMNFTRAIKSVHDIDVSASSNTNPE
ncbi:hypothetical protein JD969_09480 [Planctomycetota bacterium]|nr:hypothetical protein JD969_09480 [Planctomycetota bacterium]